MLVHTIETDVSDLTKVYNELNEKITLSNLGGYNPPGQAAFAHIAGGYDAGYCRFCNFAMSRRFFPFAFLTMWRNQTGISIQRFGSLSSFTVSFPGRISQSPDGVGFSQAFAADMFAEVFAKDPLSSSAGLRYREQILKPGGSRYVRFASQKRARALSFSG
jgi:Zn-dependent oligopeptidase